MSDIRTLLCVLEDEETGRAPLETALRLADQLACHVEGFHVLMDATTAVPCVGEAMAGALVEEMVEAAEREARDRARKARTLFDSLCQTRGLPLEVAPPGPDGPSASWQEARGPEPEQVALRGRVADLVVIGQPGARGAPPSLLTLNAALMDSGRPVLVAPPTPPETIGRRVAIAWNGSAEAARAVMGAMPFLARAETVTILIATDRHGPEAAARVERQAHELERHLAWHGITAQTEVLEDVSGGQAGSALLAACTARDADLLVLGAYTHSRLRQLILGGVTRHVLDHASLPVLMSH